MRGTFTCPIIIVEIGGLVLVLVLGLTHAAWGIAMILILLYFPNGVYESDNTSKTVLQVSFYLNTSWIDLGHFYIKVKAASIWSIQVRCASVSAHVSISFEHAISTSAGTQSTHGERSAFSTVSQQFIAQSEITHRTEIGPVIVIRVELRSCLVFLGHCRSLTHIGGGGTPDYYIPSDG